MTVLFEFEITTPRPAGESLGHFCIVNGDNTLDSRSTAPMNIFVSLLELVEGLCYLLETGAEWQEVYCEDSEFALRIDHPSEEMLVVQAMDRDGQVYGQPMPVQLADFRSGLVDASYSFLNRIDKVLWPQDILGGTLMLNLECLWGATPENITTL